MSDRVPVAPLRAAILTDYDWRVRSFNDLAKAMGWTRMKDGLRVGDGTRVRRVLGISATQSGKLCCPSCGTEVRRPGRSVAKSIDYTTATLLCDAAGLDPVDVGL